LFSTDPKQEYDKIIEYYSLRFQIEFNFRNAKQFFGLEDFMNTLTYLIYKDSHFSRYSINDIKSLFVAEQYIKEALKFYGQNRDDILISNDIKHITQFSMIYGDTG